MKGRVIKQKLVNHQDLEVYRRAFDAAMAIFQLSKAFPKEGQYALTDQLRRSSRSICANLAEGWRRRRYEQAFINMLSIAEGEADTWIITETRLRDSSELYSTTDIDDPDEQI